MGEKSEIVTNLNLNGFAVLPLLSQKQLKCLFEIYETQVVPVLNRSEMYWSLSDKDKEFSTALSQAVVPIISEHLFNVIENFVPIISSFMVKPGNSPAVQFHQDWSFVDHEPDHNSFTCWIPLTDINEDNGMMGFIPKSHNEFTFYRGSPSPPFGHNFPQDETLFSRVIYLKLKAGQPVVFNHRTIHGSKPNQTPSIRPAVALTFRNTGSKLIHISAKPGSNAKLLCKYEIDDAFFDKVSNEIIADFYNKGETLPGYKIIEEIENPFNY